MINRYFCHFQILFLVEINEKTELTQKTNILLVFSVGLNHGLNQWFKPIGLNQANPGLPTTTFQQLVNSTIS